DKRTREERDGGDRLMGSKVSVGDIFGDSSDEDEGGEGGGGMTRGKRHFADIDSDSSSDDDLSGDGEDDEVGVEVEVGVGVDSDDDRRVKRKKTSTQAKVKKGKNRDGVSSGKKRDEGDILDFTSEDGTEVGSVVKGKGEGKGGGADKSEKREGKRKYSVETVHGGLAGGMDMPLTADRKMHTDDLQSLSKLLRKTSLNLRKGNMKESFDAFWKVLKKSNNNWRVLYVDPSYGDEEGDDEVYMGNLALFESLPDNKPSESIISNLHDLEEKGNTTMLVRRNNEFIGIIAVMDTPRAEAKAALAELKVAGIRRMIMLTGDNQKVAEAVAAQIGITDAWGSLLPEQKVEAIKKLRQQEKEVAMVGDGVNDAPAMANSTIGIAMGAAGSDVALETADIALMGDKLSLLPFAIRLSRKARSIIKQNLVISLGMVAILVPLTILGIASMGPAVIAHEGSTLVVVFNALRLLAFKK
ncbi:HAD family hydrolase, partial [archaeon]